MSDQAGQSDAPSTSEGSKRSTIVRICLVLLVAAVAGGLYWKFGHLPSLKGLAERETEFRSFRAENPWLVYGIAFAVYVMVTALSLPGAAAMTLTFAWLFGFWQTVPLVSFASTTGATLAFVFSRYLLRDWVQSRFSDRLKSINESFKSEGPFYLFTLRLIPAVPFFVINLVMGLTPIPLRTFWWVSQVGMLPGTLAYVYAGSQVPDLQTLAERGVSSILSLPLLAGFVLLGLFPLAVRWIMKRVRGDQQLPDQES